MNLTKKQNKTEVSKYANNIMKKMIICNLTYKSFNFSKRRYGAVKKYLLSLLSKYFRSSKNIGQRKTVNTNGNYEKRTPNQPDPM